MSYGLYDFQECISCAKRDGSPLESPIKKAIYAFGRGEGGDGNMGGWDGAFIVELENGRLALITGWCDYTGWG